MVKEWWMPKDSSHITPHLWLSPDACKFLDSIDKPEWNVLEHGAGGSTLWFAKRCKWVLSIENNWSWYEKLVSMKKEFENMSLIYTDKELSKTFPRMLYTSFDFLMIDGEPVENRLEWISNTRNLVVSKGWVCFDNCNRPEFVEAREYLKSISDEVVTFDGNTNSNGVQTQYLVTEFYRLK